MNVDLHTHTYPASDCSRISYRDYIAWCVDNAVEAVALTNHGDISDNRNLGPALAAEGVLLIHGVEISTLFGDFVIFSPDLDYLETLRAVQDAPRAGDVPDHAAVVWVHPGAGGGRSGSAYYPGSSAWSPASSTPWRSTTAPGSTSATSTMAEQIAAELGRDATGGSDAHALATSWPATRSCPTPSPLPRTSSAALRAGASRTARRARRPRSDASGSSRRGACGRSRCRPGSAWASSTSAAGRRASCVTPATAPSWSTCRTPPRA